MKRLIIIVGFIVLLLAALTVWSLGGASDANAPTDVRTIDVTPQP